jgi:3D (Asp-Asp-Asp) domain-containing protein
MLKRMANLLFLGGMLWTGGLALATAKTAKSKDPSARGQSFLPTVYYKPRWILNQTCRAGSRKELSLLDRQGQILVKACRQVFKSCLLQGSCEVLTSNESIHLVYAGKGTKDYDEQGHRIAPEIKYRFERHTSQKCLGGTGINGDCLRPFYSVAADLSLFEIGEVLYIPKLKGMVLPDGQIHDGYVMVQDAGTHIKGTGKMDFFTGEMDHLHPKNAFARAFRRAHGWTYFRVDTKTANQVRRRFQVAMR